MFTNISQRCFRCFGIILRMIPRRCKCNQFSYKRELNTNNLETDHSYDITVQYLRYIVYHKIINCGINFAVTRMTLRIINYTYRNVFVIQIIFIIVTGNIYICKREINIYGNYKLYSLPYLPSFFNKCVLIDTDKYSVYLEVLMGSRYTV